MSENHRDDTSFPWQVSSESNALNAHTIDSSDRTLDMNGRR